MIGNVFPTFLIGLREGLEATLVVSILVAYLVKSDRRGKLPLVWLGVGLAVALSVGAAALLEYTAAHLTHEQQELFDAITSIVAVCFVTWMIFWMRRAARSIGGELRDKLSEAIGIGSVAVVGMSFLAVAREGLETAVLFFATIEGSDSPWYVVAILAGILTSVVIGYFLYISAVRINLTKFFTWTGALLVLVAAGILKYGVHDLQEADVLPGLNDHAFDLSNVIDPTSWGAQLIAGMFNLTVQPSVLEMVAWGAYAVPVLILFLMPNRTPRPAAAVPTPAE
ncbi:high-affinity iron transporter [Allocatelliglobosispora scoriae]|uniref:High-affinity iron transporter n=1 Tax=Allocatelliglobosispora scoriae TaxID=643052 RepID=A0A841BME8_9ACTN|nr:iron uptake transporter permease EfeU [Allocatelliglobosispora scoriae]MBB5870247.1 high-affinity iron transporter [Allocatelliglobosispora scoriae]